MRQYTIQEYTSVHDLQGLSRPRELEHPLASGTIVSLRLLARVYPCEGTSLNAYWIGDEKPVELVHPELLKAAPYCEELSFEILSWDETAGRYNLQVSDFFGCDMAVVVESVKRFDGGVDVYYTNEIWENVKYNLEAAHYKSLGANDYLHWNWRENQAKNLLLDKLVQYSDSLVVPQPGAICKSLRGVRIRPEEQQDYQKSQLLATGQQITCKPKNVRLVLKPAKPYRHPPAQSFSVLPSEFVTNWNGQVMHNSNLDLIIVGCIVRICVDVADSNGKTFGGGAYYVLVVRIDSDKLLGKVMDTYVIDSQVVTDADGFVEFTRQNVSEIPTTWGVNAQLKFTTVKSAYGFMTGYRG